jgi:hypothetical protein
MLLVQKADGSEKMLARSSDLTSSSGTRSKNNTKLKRRGLRSLFGNMVNGIAVEVSTFSDTFLVTISAKSDHKSNDKANTFVLISGVIIAGTIFRGLEKNIPLRGCASVGEFYVSRRRYMLIGQPIDEAAEYHNMLQWIGVTAAPSANNALTEASKQNHFYSRSWGRYAIPLKNGIEMNGWAVRWPIYFPLDYDPGISRRIDKIRLDITRNLDTAPSIDVSLKWRNTRDFFDNVIESEQEKIRKGSSH